MNLYAKLNKYDEENEFLCQIEKLWVYTQIDLEEQP